MAFRLYSAGNQDGAADIPEEGIPVSEEIGKFLSTVVENASWAYLVEETAV